MRQMTVILMVLSVFLTGCGTMTKVATTATASTVGAIAAGPPGAIVGAIAGDLAGEIIVEPILTIYEHKQKVKAVVKPDSFWTLLHKMTEVAGWLVGGFLIAPFLLPFVAGLLIPAPGSKKH